MNYSPTYNQVIDVADITSESEVITEPVTLQEMKNYLRLEGSGVETTGISPQTPLSLTLDEGETEIISATLVGKVILHLTREGTGMYQGETATALTFTFDDETGTLGFINAGAVGGEQVVVIYGNLVDNATNEAFAFDDTLLSELITSAREGVERFTGRSLVSHIWKVLLTNLAGEIELPYSNGATITQVLDFKGDEVNDYETIGTEFLMLLSPLQQRLTITYDVAPTVPKRLKQAIMRDVAWHYENRNDETGELSKQAQALCASYKRISTWLA